MIGAIIGGALAIGSAIAGGIASSEKNKEAKRTLEEQQRRNRQFYLNEISKDYTQRADTQNLLRKQREMYADRMKSLQGLQAVTGATGAAVAAEKEAVNKAMGEAAAGIAAQNEQRKDALKRDYMNSENGYANTAAQIKASEGASIAQAASGAINAGAGIASTDFNGISGLKDDLGELKDELAKLKAQADGKKDY